MKKNKITKSLFLAFSLVAMFALAESVSAQDKTVSYLCSQNTGVNVTFMNNGARVSVEMDGNKGVLKRVKSGSGAKYTGKGNSAKMTFWTQGKQATLVSGKWKGACTEQP